MAPFKHEPESSDFVELQRRVAIVESEVAEMKEIKDDIKAIRTALVGDETLGHTGLFSRLSTLERLIYVTIAALLVMGGERVVHLFFP